MHHTAYPIDTLATLESSQVRSETADPKEKNTMLIPIEK
jgi:hypothetical protein